MFLPMTGNPLKNIKGCRCLSLLMTENPLKYIKGCLFLLTTGNTLKISGTKFFRYRFRDFFPVPNFSDTGSETFFRYQIFPIPVPRLFSGTNFFRYRFRYHQKYEKFPIPVRRTLLITEVVVAGPSTGSEVPAEVVFFFYSTN